MNTKNHYIFLFKYKFYYLQMNKTSLFHERIVVVALVNLNLEQISFIESDLSKFYNEIFPN